MKNPSISLLFPSIDSFEGYEIFKNKAAILENMAKEIISLHSLPEEPLVIFSEGINIVFAYGQDRVIKIFPPFSL